MLWTFEKEIQVREKQKKKKRAVEKEEEIRRLKTQNAMVYKVSSCFFFSFFDEFYVCFRF